MWDIVICLAIAAIVTFIGLVVAACCVAMRKQHNFWKRNFGTPKHLRPTEDSDEPQPIYRDRL